MHAAALPAEERADQVDYRDDAPPTPPGLDDTYFALLCPLANAQGVLAGAGGLPAVPANFPLTGHQQAQAFRHCAERGRLRQDERGDWFQLIPTAPVADPAPPVAPQGGPGGGTAVGLLSIFDGTGLPRLLMDEAMADMPPGTYLHSSIYAEHDDRLARTVENRWRREHDASGRPLHKWVASDAWDLLRGEACPLRGFARNLPYGAVVILMGGFPCPDLTKAASHGGQKGLCGRQSVLFYVIPVSCWYLHHLRPDLRIFTVVENAGTMLDHFRIAIMRAIGCTADNQSVLMDSADWGDFPRQRMFIANLPANDLGPKPARRPPVWDPGWSFRPDGDKPPLMRSRAGPPTMQPSIFQCHPRHCEYDVRHEAEWLHGPWSSIEWRIKQVLPSHLHRAFDIVCRWRTRASPEHEREATRYADWVRTEGPAHGIRYPSLAERVRSTGRPDYLFSLGLSEWELFQATGNYFDPDAVKRRLTRPLRAALVHGYGSPPAKDPPGLYDDYCILVGHVSKTQYGIQDSPFPDDLHDWLVSGAPPAAISLSVLSHLHGGPATDTRSAGPVAYRPSPDPSRASGDLDPGVALTQEAVDRLAAGSQAATAANAAPPAAQGGRVAQ